MSKTKLFIVILTVFLTFSLSASNNTVRSYSRGGFVGNMMNPMTDVIKAIMTPMTEMFEKSMDTMLEPTFRTPSYRYPQI